MWESFLQTLADCGSVVKVATVAHNNDTIQWKLYDKLMVFRVNKWSLDDYNAQ